MDKYEFNIKVDQIKKMMGKGDLETAMKIADTIDWRRVRNANLLSMISSVYEKNEEYQEAKDILLIAFERAPVGKRLLYKLTQLAVKQGNVQEAEGYYREFCDLAGDDSRQDILRYLILKAKGAPLEQLIHTLESYTGAELDEKWLYELAELYHQAGMEDECVRTCDKIMLMFGLGQYVDKAMELKLQYAPLTKYQMDLVENRDKYEEKLKQVEQNGGGGLAASAQMGYGNADPIYQEGARAIPAGMEGMAGQPEAGSVQGYGAYPMPGAVPAGAYGVYPPSGAAPVPGHGGYPQQEESAVPGHGGYLQQEESVAPGHGGYLQQEERAVPGYGGYPQQDAVSAVGQGYAMQDAAPAPGYGAYPQPEGTPVGSYGVYGQPEIPGPGSKEPIPMRVRVEPRPIPVAPQAPEMYQAPVPAQETAVQQTREEMVSGISASLGAGGYERTNVGVTVDENLVASVREAEVEASLAEEMSKISMNGYTEGPTRQRTRVLNDVKDLKDSEALAGKTKVYGDIRHIQEMKASREQAKGAAAQNPSVQEPAGQGTPVRGAVGREEQVKESAAQAPARPTDRVRTAPQVVYPHMMVETRSAEIGLEIAVETLKKAHQILGFKHPVVKITGDKLDQKGIAASAAKLAGKDLIVEEAGDLSDEMLKELDQLLDRDTTQMLVMLVDTPRQMNGICKAVPALASRFKVVTSMDEAEFYLYEMTGHKRERERGAEIIRMAASEPESAPSGPAVRRAADPPSAGPAAYSNREKSAAAPVQPQRSPAQPAVSRPRAVESGYGQSAPAEILRTDRPAVKKTQSYGGGEQEVRVVGKAPKEEPRRVMAFQEQDEDEDDQTVMGIDEFAQCCCAYADQIDCSITGKSMLALYERIEIMEADGVALTKSAAEDLIEEAADKAEKPSLGKRLTGLFSSKYDKNGSLILKEEHFI